MTRGHLQNFSKNQFKNFVAFVSGKPSSQLETQLISKLGQINPNIGTVRTFTQKQSEAKDHFITRVNSVQSSVRVGKLMVSRNHSDYPGVLLLNHILGGFFGSRLMKNIREEKGLTYGIHSSIHALMHGSYVVIGADVNKENRQLTIDEIRTEIARLRSDRIPEAELEIARNHFIGSLQSDMSTPFAHADKHKVISLFKLNHDYYQQLIQSLLALTQQDLLEIAQKHFQEESLLTASVG
ncbi:insulinase family protein [Oscillatoria amoena NRMC-F 0135]|nr:insulinase family protein [Oscillatoria amoena NRMC-F 0135]